ncbi:MAG TPA: DUF6111 family protein [Beijerinckiaceae bacterium]
MSRVIFEEAVLFLAPFLLFGLYLVLRRRNPFHGSEWEGKVGWLLIAGLAIVVTSLLLTGIFAGRSTGQFVPTHIENGRVVPGQFR